MFVNISKGMPVVKLIGASRIFLLTLTLGIYSPFRKIDAKSQCLIKFFEGKIIHLILKRSLNIIFFLIIVVKF